ncbi:DUF6895 family protein [Natrinema salsiterrestre]|uniref:DUF6895 domain-containing protein n=1 Tax=Natrinema salsiterrestre TaxID=2950540 RepID=A0A9Q4L1B2_9EURY|nr:hypothetical protein [Natrinema salsiterrestre]MDF9744080.1 hypothetical protein [Natrinema salsiterrestre]
MDTILQEIRETADRFVTGHQAQFNPFDWEAELKSELRRKAFTELGMYLYCQEHYGNPRPEIRSHLATFVDDSRYEELLLRYPGRFTQNAFPAIALRTVGELPPGIEDAVDEAIRSHHIWAQERLPNQMVDLLVQSRLWGYDGHNRDLEQVLETSNLAHPPDILAAEKSEFYDFTHNVFLPTGWGADDPALLVGPLPYELETPITALVLRAIAMENADAVLELLITGVIQGQLSIRLIEQSLRWIQAEKLTDSHVIGPKTSGDGLENSKLRTVQFADEWGPETREWAEHYHTNLVAGMAATIVQAKLPKQAADDEERLTTAEFREAVALGRALNQLHSYQLSQAAETLTAISPNTFRRYPDITQRITEFFERQRTGDSYGHWIDERRLYTLKTGDDAGFESELVESVSARCHEAVDHIPDPDQPLSD